MPKLNLTPDDVRCIAAIADQQIALMDQLEIALEAGDELRALNVARELVGLEREVKQQ
jgi:hypothetical protein